MAAHIDKVQNKLIAAIQAVSKVIDRQEVAQSVRQRALRELCDALDQLVKHHEFWYELCNSPSGEASPSRVLDVDGFFEQIADVFGEAFKKFLIRCGYRSPPPPLATELIDKTKECVLAEQYKSWWDTKRIDRARDALTIFVDAVTEHVDNANPAIFHRMGHRIRQIAVGAAFMALLSRAEIKTGDEFSADLGVSPSESITIEITVPVSWGTEALAEAIDTIAAVASADNLAEVAVLPLDAVDPPDAAPGFGAVDEF